MALLAGPLQAQEGMTTVYHSENDGGAVTTLSARDPEGVTPPMVWSVLVTSSAIDVNGNNSPTDAVDIAIIDAEDADDFEISDAGVLTFAIGEDDDPPNFEDASDAGMNNEYKVVVQASDGGKTDKLSYFKVVVRVTDEEETGKVTWTVDPDGQGNQMLRQFQNGATLTASVTDPDGDANTTVSAGNVVSDFGIDTATWQWYRGSAMSGPWTMINGATRATYEVASPADVDKYLRVVAGYTDRRGSGKSRELVSTHPVKEALANNAPPEFSLTTVTRTLEENTAKGMNIGARVTATDADDTVLTYALDATSSDNDKFDIDAATGQLMTMTKLNYEANDGEADNCATRNECSVTVRATDPSGAAATATVTIRVTNVNDKPMFTAGIEGMAEDHREDSLTENDIADSDVDLTVDTYTATDPESGDNVTLSLSGDDMGKFELTGSNAGTRELAFKMKPDFEMRGDRNEDNIYEVTVVASDGTMEAMRSVTVKVTDADEAGKVTLSTQDAQTGAPITATLTDSDGGVTGEEWTWHRVAATGQVSATTVNAIEEATSATYTPVVADDSMRLMAMVSYVDRTYDEDNNVGNNAADGDFEGFMNVATSMATTAVRDDPANKAPEFKDSSAQRFVMENTDAGMAIGMPITAKDDDAGQMVIYSLGGADKDSFTIDAVTDDASEPPKVAGQVRTKATLDHESKDTYRVTVIATDSSGESNDSASIPVTITVADMDEGPMIIGPTTTVDHSENDGGAVTTLSARDPEGVTPPMVWSVLVTSSAIDVNGNNSPTDAVDIAIIDAEDADDFEISDAGVLTFAIGEDDDPPNFEDASDAGMNNEYKVVVQASDGGKTDKLSYFKVVVRVTDEEETGKVTWTVDPDGQGNQMLRQFQNGATLTASVTDPDGDANTTVSAGNVVSDFGIDTVTWQWYRGSAMIDGAISAMYTVTADDVRNRLKVVASYTDRRGSGKSRELVSTHPVKEGVADNKSPEFSLTTVTRTLEENTAKGMNIGARVTATDADDTGVDLRTRCY